MSTLTVTNIKATGETASRAVSGVAAAWVNFNGTGTPAIRDSVNTSSITDYGTGIYSGNFSSNMSSGNYNAVCVGNDAGSAKDAMMDASSLTSSAIYGFWQLSGVSFYDAEYGNFLCHGDLA